MSEFYTRQQRQLQQSFNTEALADRVADFIVHHQIDEMDQGFIESRDMFFLSTVNADGQPTVSYKGGSPGFVKVLDKTTLAFPSYDGNGMFLSLGNIMTDAKIGMLFIDLENPHRMRLHGVASLHQEDTLMADYPGAQLIVRVAVSDIFVNCPRYVHRYQKVADSKYVPKVNCETPLAPWKRIDGLQDVLPSETHALVNQVGGTITPEEYGAMVMTGKA